MKKILLSAGIIIAAVTLLWLGRGSAPLAPATSSACPDFSRGALDVGGHTFTIGVAATPAEQSRGLSGCPQLPPAAGLLFPYDPPQVVTFWMKDMLMPLDIIWIAQGRVVGIAENVLRPAPNTPDEQLARYTSPQPIDAVLEIAAGGARQQGITPGASVHHK